MKRPETNWPSWVAKADNDLLCIRNNLAADRIPWDTVCYHAQQVVEKMLKAFLVFHGRQPRKTHDLVAVLHECVASDSALADLIDDCEALNAYSVEARYPGDIFEPAEPEGRAAVGASTLLKS